MTGRANAVTARATSRHRQPKSRISSGEHALLPVDQRAQEEVHRSPVHRFRRPPVEQVDHDRHGHRRECDQDGPWRNVMADRHEMHLSRPR